MMQGFKEQILQRIKTSKVEGRCPMLFTLTSLKVLGRIPFTKDGAGVLHFRVLSLPTAWAAAVTTLQVSLVVRIYFWHLGNFKPEYGFDKIISTINDLLFLNTSFHGVLASWRSSPRIVKAVNRWTTFQKQAESAIGKPMTSLLLDHSYLGVITASLVISLMLLISYMSYARKYYFEIVIDVLYFLCIFYFNIFVWLWIEICVMVKKTAELLNDHLVQVLSDSPTPDDILSVRRLWLELHGSTLDLVDGLASTLQLWKATGFTINLFTVYCLLTLAFDGKFAYLSFLISALVITTVSGYAVFAVSDFAQTSVTGDIISTICSGKFTALPGPVQSQLGLLLDAVEMGSPCFEVKGTYIVDKVYYISLIYGIITNLVVLMQFKVSTTTTAI